MADIPPPPSGFDDGSGMPSGVAPAATKATAASRAAESLDESVQRSEALEAAAQEVEEGRRLLISLDQRMNSTREALRALKNEQRAADAAAAAKAPAARTTGAAGDEPQRLPAAYFRTTDGSAASGDAKTPQEVAMPSLARSRASTASARVWLYSSGGVFMATPRRCAAEKLEREMVKLTTAIEDGREELRQAVCELAKLEGPDSALARLNRGFELKDGRK